MTDCKYLTGLHIWGTGEVHTGFWWGDLKERVHLGDPGVNGRIIQGDQKVSLHLMITI